MSNLMFPESVQKQIIQLHIAYLAGLHLSNKQDTLNAEKRNIKTQIADFKITSCASAEETRISMLKGLEQTLEQNYYAHNEEAIAISDTLHADLEWSYNASDYAERYEKNIHMANLEGAEIYDSCLIYTEVCEVENLSLLMNICLELADKHQFKVKFEADPTKMHRCAGTLKIYTTTFGMHLISEHIRTSDTLTFDTTLKHMFYAMPLDCPAFIELKEKSLKERRRDILDNVAVLKTGSWMFNTKDRYEEIGRMFAAIMKDGVYFQETIHHGFTRNGERLQYFPSYDAERIGKKYGFEETFKLLLSK
ncbi:hypothetical protein [Vibrio owensii]|uniref:hypothetical protein n=1 Tax=Vibrio harveyi group TaxID=717610 RepID=UPI003CC631D3